MDIQPACATDDGGNHELIGAAVYQQVDVAPFAWLSPRVRAEEPDVTVESLGSGTANRAANDTEWSDPSTKAEALNTLVEQLDSLDACLGRKLSALRTSNPIRRRWRYVHSLGRACRTKDFRRTPTVHLEMALEPTRPKGNLLSTKEPMPKSVCRRWPH